MPSCRMCSPTVLPFARATGQQHQPGMFSRCGARAGRPGETCCRCFEDRCMADAARWESLEDLRGRRLRCHCAAGTPCHADILAALFCTKLVETMKAAGQSPGVAVGQSPSSLGSGDMGPSVSSGEFPGTAAATISCPLPSVGGRRESTAASGEFLGQAKTVRALPAVTPSPAAVATPRRAPRANSWGSTCRHGHSRPAAAVTAALATPRLAFRANSRDSSRQLGRTPGPQAVAVGTTPTSVIYRFPACRRRGRLGARRCRWRR